MQTFPIITFGSIVPMEHPDKKVGIFPLPEVSVKDREEVKTIILPVLENTGFYQKTEFYALCVCIEFATEEQVVEKELKFHNYKAHKVLNVVKRFVWKNECQKSSSEWKSFLLAEVGKIILLVCSKYSLDLEAAREGLNKLGVEASSEDKTGVFTESEPVEITVRIPFTPSEDLNIKMYFDMEDQLQKAFSLTKAGRVEGHSFSSEFFEIYCMGHESTKMQQTISETFASVQQEYGISVAAHETNST